MVDVSQNLAHILSNIVTFDIMISHYLISNTLFCKYLDFIYVIIDKLMKTLAGLFCINALREQMATKTQQQNTDGSETSGSQGSMSDYPLFNGDQVDQQKCRYPHSIVWTPIPCITWVFNPRNQPHKLPPTSTDHTCKQKSNIQAHKHDKNSRITSDWLVVWY